jgi:hypothetical protein
MHYALQRACPGSVVLDAFDVNHAANTVYQHNFSKQPRQVRVTTAVAGQLVIDAVCKPGSTAAVPPECMIAQFFGYYSRASSSTSRFGGLVLR